MVIVVVVLLGGSGFWCLCTLMSDVRPGQVRMGTVSLRGLLTSHVQTHQNALCPLCRMEAMHNLVRSGPFGQMRSVVSPVTSK